MKKKSKQALEDDGRVIANMNVPGMPWYDESASRRGDTKKDLELSRSETWAVIGGALKAGAIITLFFAVVFILVVILVGRWGDFVNFISNLFK